MYTSFKYTNKQKTNKTKQNKISKIKTKQNYFLLVDKGLPDFRPPENVLESLSNAAIGENHMLNHYTRSFVSNIIIYVTCNSVVAIEVRCFQPIF